MASEDVVLNIRTRGGRQAAQEAGIAAAGIRGISSAAKSAGSGMDSLGRKMTNAPFRAMANQARYAAYGIAALGGFAVKSGLQFNSTMEQNQISFTQFLGSAAAARKETSLLFNIAAKTPFQFSGVATATKQLLAYGMTLKQANSWLMTISDTISGLGGGQEQIDRMVMAIGQISAKPLLQAQDLRQLNELGIKTAPALMKAFHLTAQQVGDIGNQHIESAKAVPVLQRALTDQFGGLSAKQQRTFQGQISSLKDYASQTLGAITLPLFKSLEKTTLPAMTRTTQAISKEFARTDIGFGEKLKLSQADVKHNLGPTWDSMKQSLHDAHIPAWLGKQFERDAPMLMESLGRTGGHLALAFIKGWWHAGPWGKLFGVYLVASRFGVFGWAGGLAGDHFRGRFEKTAAERGSLSALGTRMGRIIGPAAGIAAAAFIAYEIERKVTQAVAGGPIDIAGASVGAGIAADTDRSVVRARSWNRYVQQHPELNRRFLRRHPGDAALRNRLLDIDAGPRLDLTTAAGRRTAAEERRIRGTLRRHGDPTIVATSPAMARALHLSVYIDGKQIAHHMATTHAETTAKGVNRANADRAARGQPPLGR